ncbi:MAG: phosphatidate cytidylyltransferase [Betaproteobacteria bacterium]
MSWKGLGEETAARVLTGIVGIPIVLALVYVGGAWLLGALAVIATAMLWEYRRLVASQGSSPHPALLLSAGLAAGGLVATGRDSAVAAAIFAALALDLALALSNAPEESLLRRGGALALGALYIGYPLGLMARLRALAPWWLAVGFALVWANDVLAYVVGVSWGRHRLAPRISPKKSVEGAVGGLLATAIAAVVLRTEIGLGVGRAAVLGLAVAAAGLVGDLLESALKREAGIKDSGRLLPGHGGFLDRFDSALLAFPVYYLLLKVLR